METFTFKGTDDFCNETKVNEVHDFSSVFFWPSVNELRKDQTIIVIYISL